MRAREEFVGWAKNHGWSCQPSNGGHLRLTHPQVPAPHFAPRTPSDVRSYKNCRADMKRALRNAGVLPDRKPHQRSIGRRKSEPFPLREEKASDGALEARIHTITCSACGATAEVRQAPKSQLYNAATVAILFRKRGWYAKMERATDLCPACCKSSVAAAEMSESRQTIDQARNLHRPVWEQRRKIVGALQRLYLDPEVGYVAGEDDATVAARLKVEPELVAQVRAANFGPLVKGTEITVLEREVGRLERELKAFTNRVVDGAAKLEGALDRLKAQLAGLRPTEERRPHLNGASVPNGVDKVKDS